MKPLQDIHDTHPPLPLPEPFEWLWLWVSLAIISLIALVSYILVYRRKHKKDPPAVDIARAELHTLFSSKDFTDRDYVAGVSRTIRSYAQQSLGMHALEMTDQEFYHSMRAKLDENNETIETIKVFSQRSELIKFSQTSLSEHEKSQINDQALQIVDLIHQQSQDE